MGDFKAKFGRHPYRRLRLSNEVWDAIKAAGDKEGLDRMDWMRRVIMRALEDAGVCVTSGDGQVIYDDQERSRRFREMVEASGMTHAEVAEAIGTSKRAIESWMTRPELPGHRSPSMMALNLFGRILNERPEPADGPSPAKS